MITKTIQKYAKYLRQPSVVTLVLAAAVSFTPYYAISIFAVVLVLSIAYPVSKRAFFHNLLTRSIVTFLAFEAWVMLLAMYGWIGRLTPWPIIYISSFLALYLIARHFSPRLRESAARREGSGPIRRRTLLSACLASIGLLVVLFSFYTPRPSLASTVQIITNGYDNSAHLSLIRTTSEAGGYVYGSYEDIGDQIAWKTLTAYPQGWHFANAFVWNGLGGSPFQSTDASFVLILYVTTLFIWYFMALFIFNQVLLYSIFKDRSEHVLSGINVMIFSGLSILLQLLVFWGALLYGFGTFLCALVYLFLLVALVVHYQHLSAEKQRQQWSLLVLAALGCAMAVAQGWLFATPIVAAIMLLCFVPRDRSPLHFLPLLRTKRGIATVVAGLLVAAPILIQGLINIRFSTQGAGQVNDDGGIFGISTNLALVLVVLALAALASAGSGLTKNARSAGSIVLLPALGFTGLLLLYQLLTLGHTAYFFTKSLAIVLCLAWLPLTHLAFSATERMRKQLEPIYLTGLIAAVFLTLPFMLGQDTTSFQRLLQRESNVTTSFAEKLADSARSGELKEKRVFLITNGKYDGDVIGSIFALTAMQRHTPCTSDALWVVITRRLNEFPYYANLCSPQDSIKVITGEDTPPALIHGLEPAIEVTR